MYGEGHDYAPQYTAMSGDMAGSLPVGIETHFERDEPYWPPDNCYNYKEVWVHPSARWLSLMCDLYGADAKPEESFSLAQETSAGGEVTITLTTEKRKTVNFAIRAWNLEQEPLHKLSSGATGPSGTVVWRTKIEDKTKPWVAVVMPGGDFGRSKDIVGNFPNGRK